MIIRQEIEKNTNEVYALIEVAFKTAQVADGDEQDYYLQLKKGKNFIPELALVAELDGKIIGQILFTKIEIKHSVGLPYGLLLAPIAVLIDYREKGIGSALIKRGFELATEMGYKAVFLAGDPAYYSRFGFKPCVDYGVANANPVPDKYVMAYELVPDALKNTNGAIEFEVGESATNGNLPK